MSCYYMQHRGNEINKIVEATGKREKIRPEPDCPNDKVGAITADEYALLKACNGDMDYLLRIVKRLIALAEGKDVTK